MNGRKQYPSNFWIGLAKVQADSTKILGAKNAYVNVVGVAENRRSFRQKVKDTFEEMHLKLQSLEDVEHLSNRIENFEVDENILLLAEGLLKGKDQIRYSTFYIYD